MKDIVFSNKRVINKIFSGFLDVSSQLCVKDDNKEDYPVIFFYSFSFRRLYPNATIPALFSVRNSAIKSPSYGCLEKNSFSDELSCYAARPAPFKGLIGNLLPTGDGRYCLFFLFDLSHFKPIL